MIYFASFCVNNHCFFLCSHVAGEIETMALNEPMYLIFFFSFEIFHVEYTPKCDRKDLLHFGSHDSEDDLKCYWYKGTRSDLELPIIKQNNNTKKTDLRNEDETKK